MKILLWSVATVAAVAVSFQPLAASAPQSLRTDVDMNAPAPRLSNGKPDFSGVWARPRAQDMTLSTNNANGTSVIGEPNPLPLTPWGQAQWDNYDPVAYGDYAGSCMPFGWIRSFHPHPMQIVQNNEYITFLFEQSTMFQVVNTEGMPHRDEWPPTWFGDSRGRWEGDALVIESVNFNGWAKLGTIGHPMSDQATLTMTFERPDMGHMRFRWEVEDPKTYTRPISNERVFVLTPDVELMEYACMEGNLSALIDRVITPWLGPTEIAENLAYPPERQWDAYDQTRQQELTGVVRETTFAGPHGVTTVEVGNRMVTVVLAPPTRLDFRNVSEEMLSPGVTITVQGFPHVQNNNEFRAEILTIGTAEFEMR